MARPSKLNPDVQARVVKAMEGAATRKVAAQSAGIDESTLHNWMRRGRLAQEAGASAEDDPFVEFYEAVERASVKPISEALDRLSEASKKDWRAAAWLLERRYPGEWGRPRRNLVRNVPLEKVRSAIDRAVKDEGTLSRISAELESLGLGR